MNFFDILLFLIIKYCEYKTNMAPSTTLKKPRCRQTGGVLPQKETIKRTGLFWGKKNKLFRGKHIDEYEQEDYTDIELLDYDKFAADFFRNNKNQQIKLLTQINNDWQTDITNIKPIFLLGLKLGVKTYHIFESNEYPRLYGGFINPSSTIGTKYNIQTFIKTIFKELQQNIQIKLATTIGRDLYKLETNVLDYITDKNFLDEYKRFVRHEEPYSESELSNILANASENGKRIIIFYKAASVFGYDSLDFTTLEKQRPDREFYNKLLEMNKQIGFLTPLQIESLCNKQSSSGNGNNKSNQKHNCSKLREELVEINRGRINPNYSLEKTISEIAAKTIRNIAGHKRQLGRNTKGSMGIKDKPSSSSLKPSLPKKTNNIELEQMVRKSGALIQPVNLPSPPKSGIIHIQRHSRDSNDSRTRLVANENARIASEAEKYKANLKKWFANRK